MANKKTIDSKTKPNKKTNTKKISNKKTLSSKKAKKVNKDIQEKNKLILILATIVFVLVISVVLALVFKNKYIKFDLGGEATFYMSDEQNIEKIGNEDGFNIVVEASYKTKDIKTLGDTTYTVDLENFSIVQEQDVNDGLLMVYEKNYYSINVSNGNTDEVWGANKLSIICENLECGYVKDGEILSYENGDQNIPANQVYVTTYVNGTEGQITIYDNITDQTLVVYDVKSISRAVISMSNEQFVKVGDTLELDIKLPNNTSHDGYSCSITSGNNAISIVSGDSSTLNSGKLVLKGLRTSPSVSTVKCVANGYQDDSNNRSTVTRYIYVTDTNTKIKASLNDNRITIQKQDKNNKCEISGTPLDELFSLYIATDASKVIDGKQQFEFNLIKDNVEMNMDGRYSLQFTCGGANYKTVSVFIKNQEISKIEVQ